VQIPPETFSITCKIFNLSHFSPENGDLRSSKCPKIATEIYNAAKLSNLTISFPELSQRVAGMFESGKLVYSSTFGHVPTYIYMSHRPNDSFVPEQQRK